MVKTLVSLVVAAAILGAPSSYGVDPWKEPGGLVPDAEAAIKIAEAILFPIYGEDTIKRERPYNAELKNGFWYVHGSMPKGSGPLTVGGTFFISISQWDGRVIEVGHML